MSEKDHWRSLEELSTIVIEVEMVVNSRPLTYVSLTDLEEPVTPSHLLIAGADLGLNTWGGT